MTTPLHLIELARQVRQGTLQLLAAAEESWLTWAPPGTSTHILWHAGHALWLQDALCIEPLTGRSELPTGWADKFGMRCRPVALTKDWPSRKEIAEHLTAQLQRMLDLFHSDIEGRLQRIGPNASRGWDEARDIIHGLHDEARHQGEMYLLMKLRRAVGPA